MNPTCQLRVAGCLRLNKYHVVQILDAPGGSYQWKPSFGIVPALPRGWKAGNESYRRAPNPDKRGRWTAAPSFSPFVVITYCWLF
jgi:hypothetical protein